MPRAIRIILYTLLGYFVAAGLGYFFMTLFSNNQHDRALEAIMSAIFIAGTIGATIGCLVGLVKTS